LSATPTVITVAFTPSSESALIVFATGHLTVFVALAVLALAALLTLSPGRVAG